MTSSKIVPALVMQATFISILVLRNSKEHYFICLHYHVFIKTPASKTGLTICFEIHYEVCNISTL